MTTVKSHDEMCSDITQGLLAPVPYSKFTQAFLLMAL